MTRMLAVLSLLLLAVPAAAQVPAASLPAQVPFATRAAPPAGVPQISAGHAAALGAGMFVGALAGSALIHGGALAALIGAAAGVTVGHWYWTEHHRDDAD
ncbi:hypothetical protein [Roseomonas fluvialis]|uniref:Glycine zipper domain-containing protein n=1 Tax=Roseomonas fluvialis TaxID=1750527 RepID=A0ABM7XXZ8_9PROT|nr:hypothetical protein [Roseomonas fluvialis]BDG70361.1 hypothetical protein Rmf_02900 [Roseomonas fluvialis]